MRHDMSRWKTQALCLPQTYAVDLIQQAYNGDFEDVVMCSDLDSVWFESTSDDTWSPDADEIVMRLSEYLGVAVTSFHIDDCTPPNLWIAYRGILGDDL